MASLCIIKHFKLRYQIWGILNSDSNKMTSNNALFFNRSSDDLNAV